MDLTKEQIDIINSSGNIKINAVAGSGKTTTIIEYAKSRPKNSKILYLAFNKSVKIDAIKKFADKGLSNVKIETAHSLAYRHIVFTNDYKVISQDYKIQEITEILKLQGNGEKLFEFIIANHINKFFSYFCNSDKNRVQEVNYLDIVKDSKAKAFVTTFYKYIENQTQILYDKMDKGEIDITHNFYLKKFQLSNPILNYDYILFDEGQDASPAMLDIIFKQKATKVIVGDTHQQIYGWRYAVNSLEKANYKTYTLSTSFRFNQDIANLAKEILNWKNHIYEYDPPIITGNGVAKTNKVKAVIARTNVGLLFKAIEYISEKKSIKNIYFEGNINSYTYANDGASLYDVLNLYNGKQRLIKDKLIKGMKDINELKDYIDKTGDIELGMMIEIVKKYGNRIPDIIKTIKDKHVENDEKGNADMIFSTVHRSKGMEYDAVQIVNDFITEEKLEKQLNSNQDNDYNSSKLNEEINLLYVAITRTRNLIYIPETLLPKDYPPSPNIHILKVTEADESVENDAVKIILKPYNKTKDKDKEKAYNVIQIREKLKDAYKPWTRELDKELTTMFYNEVKTKDIAKHFGRTDGAIRSRITKLELDVN